MAASGRGAAGYKPNFYLLIWHFCGIAREVSGFALSARQRALAHLPCTTANGIAPLAGTIGQTVAALDHTPEPPFPRRSTCRRTDTVESNPQMGGTILILDMGQST